jgi:hypothetical protein
MDTLEEWLTLSHWVDSSLCDLSNKKAHFFTGVDMDGVVETVGSPLGVGWCDDTRTVSLLSRAGGSVTSVYCSHHAPTVPGAAADSQLCATVAPDLYALRGSVDFGTDETGYVVYFLCARTGTRGRSLVVWSWNSVRREATVADVPANLARQMCVGSPPNGFMWEQYVVAINDRVCAVCLEYGWLLLDVDTLAVFDVDGCGPHAVCSVLDNSVHFYEICADGTGRSWCVQAGVWPPVVVVGPVFRSWKCDVEEPDLRDAFVMEPRAVTEGAACGTWVEDGRGRRGMLGNPGTLQRAYAFQSTWATVSEDVVTALVFKSGIGLYSEKHGYVFQWISVADVRGCVFMPGTHVPSVLMCLCPPGFVAIRHSHAPPGTRQVAEARGVYSDVKLPDKVTENTEFVKGVRKCIVFNQGSRSVWRFDAPAW